MKRTFSKGMFSRVAPNAYELATLFYNTNATDLPRCSQLRFTMCEGTRRIGAGSVHKVPAKTYFVRKTLKANMTGFATTKTNHVGAVTVHIGRYCRRCDEHMRFGSIILKHILYSRLFFIIVPSTQCRALEISTISFPLTWMLN